MIHQSIFFLGLLQTHSLSGQHIHEIVRRQKTYFGDLIEPQSVFTELEHLVQRNYLARDMLSSAQGTYRLTETGLHYFYHLIYEGLQIHVPLSNVADNSLLLLRYLSPDDVIALFTTRYTQLRQAYTSIARLYMRRFPDNEAHSMVYDHLCTLLHTEMVWTDALIKQIGSQPSHWRFTSVSLDKLSLPVPMLKLSAARLNEEERRDVLNIVRNLLELRSLGLSRADFALYFLPTLQSDQAVYALQERIVRVEQILRLLKDGENRQVFDDPFSYLIYNRKINLLEAERSWLERRVNTIGGKDGDKV